MDKKSYDINILYNDLSKLFRSPNLFSFYYNAKKIKEKFNILLSDLTNNISKSFDLSQNDSLINYLYKKSDYSDVWYRYSKNYILESKDFDLDLYFRFLKLINPKKYFLAKAIFYLKKQAPNQYIEDFIVNNSLDITLDELYNLYNELNIENISVNNDDILNFLKSIYIL